MQQMDCINQQARERGLTKRSQAERLAIADSLIASVWEEYLNGSIDRGTLQVAAYIQTNVNGIVWKLNELNNHNTPNTLKALDCISRQAAIDEFDKGAWGVEWDKVLAKAMIGSLPSAQLSCNKLQQVATDCISRQEAIDALEWKWAGKAAMDAVKALPSVQPDRSAKERYEDLCEYFKDCPDKGMSILDDRKEFKAWLERVHWHVVRCDELGRELEKLKSVQPEIIRCKDCKWWGKYSDTRGYCLAAKHGYWSEHWDISIRRTYDADWYCADAERREDGERE